MMSKTIAFALAVAVVAAPVLVPGVSAPAQAQSCSDLWYRRNAIYAQAGYCFQTARARATFGAGCFPPYGRLSPRQQARVNQLQAMEDSMGCPR